MNILVLNGSPKGNASVTKQHIMFLNKSFTKDTFTYLNVGTQIKSYEKEDKLILLKDEIIKADLIIFAYPVYTFLAPAQLHKLIEIMQENKINLENTYTTQFTTSKHFYDVTAHGIIKENILDLKGKYLNGLSLDMEDMLNKKGQDSIINWFKFIKYQIENQICEFKIKDVICVPKYNKNATLSIQKNNSNRVLVITDNIDDESLSNMIDDFCSLMPYKTDVYNLNNFNFKCGCLGCLKCTSNGVCQVNDGFTELLNDTINKYDSIVMAFSIKNHAFSSLFKTYFDRQFVNGHRPVTAGSPTAYIISGALSQEPTLQQYLDAKASVGGNYNCGIISDEANTLESIKTTVLKLTYSLENKYKPTKDFYEVGGMRIFRDMIWIMRGLMKADYDFYKKNNMLDFPQKKRGTMIAMKFVGKLTKSRAINKKMPNMLSDGMLMSYKKVLDKVIPIE